MQKKLLVMFLLSTIVCSCIDNRTKEKLLSDAQYYTIMANEDDSEIVELCNKAVNKETNDGEFDVRVYSNIAQNYWLHQHRYKTAIEYLLKATKIENVSSGTRGRVHMELAYQFYCNKNYNESISTYLKGLEFDGRLAENFKFNVELGRCYNRTKQYDFAIKYLTNSIEIHEKYKIQEHSTLQTLVYVKEDLARIYSILGDKAMEKKYQDQAYSKETYSPTPSTQSNFEKWLYNNTAVIEVRFESDYQIWVTLESHKYTSKSNVQQIASTIAKWYAQKMNQSFTACTVWRGSSIYAKGNYP